VNFKGWREILEEKGIESGEMSRKSVQKCLLLFLVPITLLISSIVFGGHPDRANYCKDNTNIFWFVLISDTHIGNPLTQEDSEHLNRFLASINIISPKFIMNTGDLTDHLRCISFTGGRSCDHPGEWEEYRQIVDNSGMDIDIYSDAPGNHDQYWEDVPLTLYLVYSVQGEAINQTQRSWVYAPSFGKYHFINVATPHPDYTNAINDGLANSPGELNEAERNFVETELIKHNDSNLTFVFGHHPIDNLAVGRADFTYLLANYGVSLYGYGHTHNHNVYIKNHVFDINVASLWENSQYVIVAVDCDGVSVTPEIIDQWPVVLITAPIDKNLGGTNPHAYKVPSRTENPIRALVFDNNPVSQVDYRIDGSGEWYPMSKVPLIGGSNSYLWETKQWDTTSLAPGNHTLEVRATGSNTRSDIITFEIEPKCFIATAAYGSRLAEEVRILRRLRDEYLMRNPIGRILVSLYYKYSPGFERYIFEHPMMRKVIRIGLYPVVELSKWLVREKTIKILSKKAE
jgi:predicted phosphodiesterase